MSELIYHRVAKRRMGGDEPAPALVLLHGWGADELDLLGLANALDPRVTLVCPRAPIRLPNGGYGWYQVQGQFIPVPETFRSALDSVGELLAALPGAYDVDPARVFVGGFSQGGVMTCALTLEDRRRFRGSVVLSGKMPTDEHLAPRAAEMEAHPVFVAHGSFDPVIPPSEGDIVETRFSELGAKVVRKRYAYAHNISMDTMRDLNLWMGPLLLADDADEGSAA